MSVLIEQQGQTMNFTSEPWVILSPIEQSIKEKIEKYGTPLKDWDIHIYRGILTGCNEAFIIDEAKKEELIKKDPKSASIIRPILRGRDIQRNGYEFANLYLICTFPSKHYDINDFPAIKDWLINGDWVLPNSPIGTGQLRLEQTGQEHTVNGKKFKSRKKTNNKWFETQDSISYWDDFNKPKICYSETNNAKETKIALDSSGFYPDKTCFVLVSDNGDIEHIYNILSSDIFTWYMYNTSPLLGDGGISLTKDSVLRFPLCKEHTDYGLTESEINCISESLKQ